MKSLFRYIGLLSFLTIVAFSLMVLFGYKFDFETNSFEKRGVLAITMPYKRAQISINTEEEEANIPYINLSLPLGLNTVTVSKEGYEPYTFEAFGHEEQAIKKHISLVPNLSTWTTVDSTQGPMFVSHDHIYVVSESNKTLEELTMRGGEPFYKEIALLPDVPFTDILEIHDTVRGVLLETTTSYVILGDNPRVYSKDSYYIYSTPYALYFYETVGRSLYKETPAQQMVLLAQGLNRTENHFEFWYEGDSIHIPIFSDDLSSFYYYNNDKISTDTVLGTIYHIGGKQFFYSTDGHITNSEGALVLSNVSHLNITQDILFALDDQLRLYALSDDGNSYVTTLPELPVDITAGEDHLSFFITTPSTLYQCTIQQSNTTCAQSGNPLSISRLYYHSLSHLIFAQHEQLTAFTYQ